MKIKTYYLIQLGCVTLLALLAVLSYVYLKDKQGFWGKLWIVMLVGVVAEIIETLILSKSKRFTKDQ